MGGGGGGGGGVLENNINHILGPHLKT